MNEEVRNVSTLRESNDRREWIQPEVRKIDAGAAENNPGAASDFGGLS